MRCLFLCITASLTLPGVVSGQTIKEEIERAQAGRQCYTCEGAGKGNCPCGTCECQANRGHLGSIQEEIDRAQKANSTYYELRKQAIAENKPLIIWVGYVCPACEHELEGCLHHHCGNFDGETNPCIIVGMPRGGSLWSLGTMPTNSTVTQIRETMRKTWMQARPVDRYQEYFDETKRQGLVPYAQTMRGGSC